MQQQQMSAMASDYRGLAVNQTSAISSKVSPAKTYSSATATNVRPKKEQAIIIDSVEGCTNDDYIDGLEKLMNIENIRYLSKISGSRVCVFLSNEKLVAEKTNK